MKIIQHHYNFVVVGGGLAGICAAVTAARNGIRTALVQDRPVLGGNSSKEIRVPPVGATQCNFAYSRETGLIEELFINNLYNNPTWSPEGWNLELESIIRNEPNIDLFLNCAVCEVKTVKYDRYNPECQNLKVVSVKAYCAMAETWHIFEAPHFADCSGDGIVGSGAGAFFKYGIEAASEYNEPFCPEESKKETMGLSLQLKARDTGRPIPFKKPKWINFELNEADFGPYRPVNEHFFPDTGGFWWLEWGGELDTVHDTMLIKDEVQKITIAVWDYLKNRSPLAEKLSTYELDWLGAVPGKRESRRFLGDHVLTMGDISEQIHFEDAVAYGGWGFDHHPAGGFHDKINPSTHQYLQGPHNIPLRSLYSKNVVNLFFAGRNISASHYALSSTRVMLTCAQLGEAVGMAAFYANKYGCLIKDLLEAEKIKAIQQDLFKADHHIHGYSTTLSNDISTIATVNASSEFRGENLGETWGTEPLTEDRMQLLTIVSNYIDHIKVRLDAKENTVLSYAFFQGPANASTFPEKELFRSNVEIKKGQNQQIDLPVLCEIINKGWHFLIFGTNPDISLYIVESPPGLLRYYPRPFDPIRPNPFSKWTLRSLQIGQQKAADADGAMVAAPVWNQFAYENKNISTFLNFSFDCIAYPLQMVYESKMILNPHSRPTNMPNLWVSEKTSFENPEWISLTWDKPREIERIQIIFDSSLQFHFSQSWQGYSVHAIPTIVKEYQILACLADGTENEIVHVKNNYKRNCLHETNIKNVLSIKLKCFATNGIERAQVYSLRILEKRGNTTFS